MNKEEGSRVSDNREAKYKICTSQARRIEVVAQKH